MLRSALLLSLFAAACGGPKPAPAPAPLSGSADETTPTETETDEATTAAAEPPMPACEPMLEDSKPGNHDRFVFEGASDTFGYKDAAGAVIIPATLRFAYEFGSGGIAAAVDASGRFVFLDPAGKVIAEAFAFDNGPDYFQEGFARIVDHGKVGYIDRRGTIVIAPRFDDAWSFCNGTAKVIENGRELAIDRTGAVVAP